jgi:hypothetical protein
MNIAPVDYKNSTNMNIQPNSLNIAVGNKGDEKSVAKDEVSIRAAKRAGKIECQTCKNRTYQDGSNDPGVSFKTPGKIDPAVAGSVVMAHEQEHVKNESSKAESQHRKIVSQSVALETSICPECGRVYVSGGKTTTVTKADNDQNNNNNKDYFKGNYNNVITNNFGLEMDTRV